MFIQLFVGTALIILCVINHAICLELLLRRLKNIGPAWDRRLPIVGHVLIMVVVVIGLFAAHTIEAWIWGMFYYATGELANLIDAIYFSTVTYTTLGYGDIVLSHEWHLTSSLQAVSGIILFGWSTAFLVNVRAFFWKQYGMGHYQ